MMGPYRINEYKEEDEYDILLDKLEKINFQEWEYKRVGCICLKYTANRLLKITVDTHIYHGETSVSMVYFITDTIHYFIELNPEQIKRALAIFNSVKKQYQEKAFKELNRYINCSLERKRIC